MKVIMWWLTFFVLTQGVQSQTIEQRNNREQQIRTLLNSERFSHVPEWQKQGYIRGDFQCFVPIFSQNPSLHEPLSSQRRITRSAATYEPLKTVGDSYFGTDPNNKKVYRIIVVFIAPDGSPTDKITLSQNSYLPGRIPNGTTSVANYNGTASFEYHEYIRDAIEHFFESYSYGLLDVVVDIPLTDPNDPTSTPIWGSPYERVVYPEDSTPLFDQILTDINTTYPNYFDKTQHNADFQYVLYLLTENAYAHASVDQSQEWASLNGGRTIWDGPTGEMDCKILWNDQNPPIPCQTNVTSMIHEIMHTLTGEHPSKKIIWDRGVEDFQTRTWGFDIMDHNGKKDCTNGHYGCYPMAPIEQYFYGFIKSDWYSVITSNSTDLRITPRHRMPSTANGDKVFYRIPLSTVRESFLISNHQGQGIDEAYNCGIYTTTPSSMNLVRGLHIWHIGTVNDHNNFVIGSVEDVEIAWTLGVNDTYDHPDGIRSPLTVTDYLPSTYRDNFDWIDCNQYDGPFFPSPASESLLILRDAIGGYSCGTPGNSQGYSAHRQTTPEWTINYDRETANPTIHDMFGPTDSFTPYSSPNTDFYHLYRDTDPSVYDVPCPSDRLEASVEVPREGSYEVYPAHNYGAAPTHVAITNIRQQSNGDMLFDVWFNYWEGNLTHPNNFGSNPGRWGARSMAGVTHDTLVIGPNGFHRKHEQRTDHQKQCQHCKMSWFS